MTPPAHGSLYLQGIMQSRRPPRATASLALFLAACAASPSLDPTDSASIGSGGASPQTSVPGGAGGHPSAGQAGSEQGGNTTAGNSPGGAGQAGGAQGGAVQTGQASSGQAGAPTVEAVQSLVGDDRTRCVLFTSGQVACWGKNKSGELGLGDDNNRGDQPGEMGAALPRLDLGQGVQVASLTGGSNHTCALLTDGRVKCWGHNGIGQLGLGDTEHRGDQPGEMGDALPAVDLGTGVRATSVSAGRAHTCVILVGGSVKCWGDNPYGQLGLGDTQSRGDQPGEMGDALKPVDLGPDARAVSLAMGSSHTCALLDSGKVICWGANSSGELGLGDTTSRGDHPGALTEAVDLGTGAKVVSIEAGNAFTCALLAGGTLKCWGSNNGLLATGDYQRRGDKPGQMGNALPAANLGGAVLQVAMGQTHACARLEGGVLKCWGHNNDGELALGNGTGWILGATPETVGDGMPAVKLGAGQQAAQVIATYAGTCVLLTDGRVKCWGENDTGQLGVGDTIERGKKQGETADTLPFVDLTLSTP